MRLLRTPLVAAAVVGLSGSCVGVSAAGATTRLVGPGHAYAKPCQAIAASGPGDVVQIDAAGNGTYDGDVCASSVTHLTIEGVNGRAHVDAAGHSSGGKAIWVLSGVGTVVRDVELTGAQVPDANGAGIRLEGGSLTVVGSSFHDNQEGILVNNVASIDLTVDSTEFARNGAGDGQSHNIYVGNIHHFTMRYSYSHAAQVGHLVKSRAAINDIMYNRLTEEGGTGSYELDLPNGGLTRVVGNVIQQGAATENSTLLAYGEEGASNSDSRLTVVDNTFVDDRPAGGTAIAVAAGVGSPAVVANNVVVGATTFVTQAGARLSGNCQVADPGFVDRAAYDYHLRETSPCRDVASPSPSGGLPTEQYVYNLGHETRPVHGAPDAGAFEWAPSVRPPLSIAARHVRKDGSIRLTVEVAGAGRLSARATARSGGKSITYARGAARATSARTLTLTLKPTRSGARALRRRHRLALRIAVSLEPTSGTTTTTTRGTTLALRRARTGVRAG
ncbi:MAG TPA: hypothetical protein VFG42_21330 [Baekduia sp.]|uniref:hypothetical protein n=1 Tax=Baekduia sp. TaxID=2600305 RepID=UPI002D76A6FB|nr:hypothetical protein [Baekduia sp.]HET6509354.1 hypothetical protein [Baekduia sp.]